MDDSTGGLAWELWYLPAKLSGNGTVWIKTWIYNMMLVCLKMVYPQDSCVHREGGDLLVEFNGSYFRQAPKLGCYWVYTDEASGCLTLRDNTETRSSCVFFLPIVV